MNSKVVSSVFAVAALGILVYDICAGEQVAPWVYICVGLLVTAQLVNLLGPVKTAAVEPGTPERQVQARKPGFSWPQIIGIALFFAGISEFLRNLRRLAEGEEALVSVLLAVVLALAGAWIIRKFKKQ